MAQIIWTEPALSDLDAIAAHIALDKPGAARRLVGKVLVRVEKLAVFPQAGGKPRELAGTPYRQIIVPTLRMFYRMAGETVVIVYVMRGERQFHPTDLSGREQ